MPNVGKNRIIETTTVKEDEEDDIETARENHNEDPQPQREVFSKGNVKERAAALKKKRELPELPGKRITFEQYLEWKDLLTEDQQTRLDFYLYRDYPYINRQLSNPDNPKYIDIFTGAPTRGDIVSIHGGGKFRLYITDKDAKKGQQLAIVSLTVPFEESEPKLNYAELDRFAKENIGYVQSLQAKGVFDSNGRINPVAAQSNQNQVNNSGGVDTNTLMGMFSKFIDMTTRMSNDQITHLKQQISPQQDNLGKSIGDILLEKMKQDDPAKLIAMLKTMKELHDTNSNTNTSQFDMMKEMMHMQSTMFGQMIQLVQAKKEDSSGGFDKDLDRMTKMMEIAEAIGGGRKGPSSAWDIVGEVASKTLGPIVNLITGAIALRAAGQGPQQAAVANQVMQQANQITESLNQENESGDVPQQPNAGQPMPNVSNPVPPGAIQALRQYGGMLLKALNDGKEGWVFAEEIDNMFGSIVVAQVANIGAENILGAMKSVPEFWNQAGAAFGEDRLRVWVNDFINYKQKVAEADAMEVEEEIVEVDEPEVLGAPVKKGKKK